MNFHKVAIGTKSFGSKGHHGYKGSITPGFATCSASKSRTPSSSIGSSEMGEPKCLEILRNVFYEPENLKPGLTRGMVPPWERTGP